MWPSISLGRFLDDFLNPRRVDAAVLNEFGERQLGDLAADVVEGRHDDDAGRVVDNDVDAGFFLEGANVAALATDDAALHFVAGDVDGGDGRFGRVLRGVPLDGHADDLAGHVLLLFFEAGLMLHDDAAGLALELLLQTGEQFAGGRLFVQARNLEEFVLLLLEDLVEFGLAGFDRFGAVGHPLLHGLEHLLLLADVGLLLFESGLAFVDAAFLLPDFFAQGVEFVIHRLATFEQFLLGFDFGGFAVVLGVAVSVFDELITSTISGPFGEAVGHEADDGPDEQADQSGNGGGHGCDPTACS